MTAKFVEYNVEVEDLVNGEIVNCIWSKTCSLLAICKRSEFDSILIFNSNGLKVASQDDQLSVKFNSKLKLFKWNPKFALIAAVWDNDQIGHFLVNDQSHLQWIASSHSNSHTSSTIMMEWISQDKLITGNYSLIRFDSSARQSYKNKNWSNVF